MKLKAARVLKDQDKIVLMSTVTSEPQTLEIMLEIVTSYWCCAALAHLQHCLFCRDDDIKVLLKMLDCMFLPNQQILLTYFFFSSFQVRRGRAPYDKLALRGKIHQFIDSSGINWQYVWHEATSGKSLHVLVKKLLASVVILFIYFLTTAFPGAEVTQLNDYGTKGEKKKKQHQVLIHNL